MVTITDEIKIISDTISKSCHVKKIILFGSFAKGTEREDSDIDICVLTYECIKKLEIARTIRKALYDNVTKRIDLLVYKPDEFYQRAESLKSIERVIRDEGISIYG